MLNDEQRAAQNPDWDQVVLNGGPPCFHVESGQFCFRAKRWAGHDGLHAYATLADLLAAEREAAIEECARAADREVGLWDSPDAAKRACRQCALAIRALKGGK